ncbi:MAG: hypothetical protein K2H02_04195 [Anaeroplasmataceae bacterium]|nr:hypothetical protein [Anaeroplasmataceae bacterium]
MAYDEEFLINKYDKEYPRIFIFNLVMNAVMNIMYCLIFFTKSVTLTPDSQGMVPENSVETIFDLIKTIFKANDFIWQIGHNTIFFLLVVFLIIGFMCSILCTFKSLYNIIFHKKIIVNMINRAKEKTSFRKFNRRTGSDLYSISIVYLVLVFVVWYILYKSFFISSGIPKISDFYVWCMLYAESMGQYFLVFTTFWIKINTAIVVILCIIVVITFIKGIYNRHLKRRMFDSF